MQYVTAGESHGGYLSAIISNVPAGLSISEEAINADLARRAKGYGRSARQELEADKVIITGGVINGKTTGVPVSLMIENAGAAQVKRNTAPRPGHADLVGALKYNFDECGVVAERASARETAARVAAAGVARELLAELDVDVLSYVTQIGGIKLVDAGVYDPLSIEMSELRCPDAQTSQAMMTEIDTAAAAGTTLGGTFKVVAHGLVAGLGGYVCATERLSSQLGASVLSIPGVKGVEFGDGFNLAGATGSAVTDEIVLTDTTGFTRTTNHAGGLEGGMTNGMPLVLRAVCKPVPTQANPLSTVDLDSLEACAAPAPRADICVVPATAVIAEAEVAFVLASAYQKKFGADCVDDMKQALRAYKQRLKSLVR